jgi:membrane protein insertase Oxa1/YidC/SpoIIIJ
VSYVSAAVESALVFIHLLCGNWAVAISLFALALKILMFPIQLYGFRQKRDGKKSVWPLLISLAQIPVFLAVYRVLLALPTFSGGGLVWLAALVFGVFAFAQQRLFPTEGMKPEVARVLKFTPILSLVVMLTLRLAWSSTTLLAAS